TLRPHGSVTTNSSRFWTYVATCNTPFWSRDRSVFCRYHITPGCWSLYVFPRMVLVAVFGCFATMNHSLLVHVERALVVGQEELPFGVLDLIAAGEWRQVDDLALAAGHAHVAIEIPVLYENGDGLGVGIVLLLPKLMQKRVARAVVLKRDGHGQIGRAHV